MEEIKKLMDQLRAALDRYLQALAQQHGEALAQQFDGVGTHAGNAFLNGLITTLS